MFNFKIFTACFATGYDSPTNNLQEFPPVQNAAACQAKCQADPRCNYFIYQNTNQRCWTKFALGPSNVCDVCVLGPKKCNSRLNKEHYYSSVFFTLILKNINFNISN